MACSGLPAPRPERGAVQGTAGVKGPVWQRRLPPKVPDGGLCVGNPEKVVNVGRERRGRARDRAQARHHHGRAVGVGTAAVNLAVKPRHDGYDPFNSALVMDGHLSDPNWVQNVNPGVGGGRAGGSPMDCGVIPWTATAPDAKWSLTTQ